MIRTERTNSACNGMQINELRSIIGDFSRRQKTNLLKRHVEVEARLRGLDKEVRLENRWVFLAQQSICGDCSNHRWVLYLVPGITTGSAGVI